MAAWPTTVKSSLSDGRAVHLVVTDAGQDALVRDPLQVGKADVVLLQQFDAEGHQALEIGLFVGGGGESGDPGDAGDLLPDFRNQDALKIGDDDQRVFPRSFREDLTKMSRGAGPGGGF